jgi:glyoxylase-like metal-dependent hydrolase (beta-lactamase superfamily II)
MRIHTIDLQFQGQPELIAAYLIESEGELALIETGPATCLKALDLGIRDAGFAPEAVRKVLVTHIHLDHAGAAGHWAARGARIFVHERGARHLADPGKLIEGARAVYGEAMGTLWGEILPVPESQLTALREGDPFRVGSSQFAVWDAPGHARHHVVLVGDGIAFTGDNTGVRLPGFRYISPATAPSQFDPDALLASLERLRAAGLERIYPTHFGAIEGSTAVTEHLDRYAALIREIKDLALSLVPSGSNGSGFTTAFQTLCRDRAQRDGVDDATWERYETANDSKMCAEGVRLWCEGLLKSGQLV